MEAVLSIRNGISGEHNFCGNGGERVQNRFCEATTTNQVGT